MAKDAFIDIHKTCSSLESPVDDKDLIYQCLFRLFSFAPSIYIKKGKVVQKTWLGSKYHEVENDECVEFYQDCLLDIYNEQKAYLAERYYKNNTKLFSDLHKIFSGFCCRGKIKNIAGRPYLVTRSSKILLEIKEISPSFAQLVHENFHYMHTPRNNGPCLGLFLQDNKLPFSVLAIEKVDRHYKKAALAYYGMSADHCYEVTRLYNVHSSPYNTSSLMLSQASTYLKNNDRYWQSTISTFMPSYATGGSMFGGGFEQILFAKPCRHLYQETPQGMATKTNRTVTARNCLSNITKIMPAIELIYARERKCSVVRNDQQILVKKSPSG
ncbi:MAG: hypothetical protein PVI21_00740 [Candidatus Woesebacteria bacterium]